MKIAIAPDSYKESLSATKVAQAIEKGFREIFPDTRYVSVPVADGGEGTVEAMIAATRGSGHSVQVTGPLDKKMNAYWGMSGDGRTAFIEMVAASGLALAPPEKRNPLVTTLHGTEELTLQALDSGAQGIIISVDGSTTNDGSAGMVQVLGAKPCDTNRTGIGYGDESLMSLNSIDISGLDPRLETCSIHMTYDMTNPLIGDSGTSHISGPQKGATEEHILELNRNLSHYVDIIKKSLRVDAKDVPGSDVAGGMGATLMTSLGAELRSSIRIVAQTLNLEEHIHNCTLVVADEGRVDSQSIHGRVSVDVASIAKRYHEPVISIGDSLTRDIEVVHQYGIDTVFSVLTSISTLEETFRGAFDNIYHASGDIAATLVIRIRSTG